MATRHHILQRLQFARLRTRIADQIAHFHPQLRKTLLHTLRELVAAVTLACSMHLARIGEELPVYAPSGWFFFGGNIGSACNAGICRKT